jgi:hypothetical protein
MVIIVPALARPFGRTMAAKRLRNVSPDIFVYDSSGHAQDQSGVRSSGVPTPLYLFVYASDLPENRYALFGPMR